MRLLSVKDLPSELWNKDMLHMPTPLRISYQTQLEKLGLMPECSNIKDSRSGVYGGRSESETLIHFAKRYGVSTCRLESLVIDPHNAFQTIPDDILLSLTEGHIAILDIACGAGAVGASFLSTISSLRRHKRIPKQPLDVYILGGDCSVHSLSLYSEMMRELEPSLLAEGINITLDTTRWEAEESYTTSQMFDMLFAKTTRIDELVIVIANFAGVLSSHFAHCEDSIKHIFDRTSNKQCTIIWVESKMKSAENLFSKLLQKVIGEKNPWHKANLEDILSHDYTWFHPFQQRALPCRVTVKKYKRS